MSETDYAWGAESDKEGGIKKSIAPSTRCDAARKFAAARCAGAGSVRRQRQSRPGGRAGRRAGGRTLSFAHRPLGGSQLDGTAWDKLEKERRWELENLAKLKTNRLDLNFGASLTWAVFEDTDMFWFEKPEWSERCSSKWLWCCARC